MGLLSSILSGLTAKNGMDQGIMKTLPNAGMDSGILKGVRNAFMPGAAAQMPELRDNAQTMLGALLQKDAGGQRHLLSNLGGMLKNPEALKYIGAAIKDMSGEDGNLQAMEQNVLAKQEQAKREAASLQSRQAINEALQNAYGDDGKFDPMAFAQGMIGSGTLTDAGDILNFAKEATPEKPKTGVEGGFGYTIDPYTGQLTWGSQRPMTYGEAESGRHNKTMERFGQGNLELGWARQRARQRAGGYGTPGASGYVDVDPNDMEPM